MPAKKCHGIRTEFSIGVCALGTIREVNVEYDPKEYLKFQKRT